MTADPRTITRQLSIMFGLAIMAEGAALVLLAGHMGALGFTGQQISTVFAMTAIAALIAPVTAGWLADRYWPSQKMAGWCQILVGPVLTAAWLQESFTGFWICMGLYALLRLPITNLINVIALHHLPDRNRFGLVRVWGTVGWIAISWGLSGWLRLQEGWHPETSHLGDGLLVGGVLAMISGIYCLRLPHTPPGAAGMGGGGLAFLAALRLAHKPEFAVLLGVSFLSAAVGPFYYNFSFLFLTDPQAVGMAPSTASWAVSLGQVSEVVILLSLATSLRRLGIRGTLLVGLGAQLLRLLVFVAGEPVWLLVASQLLHGVIFTFFHVGLVLAVEELGGKELKASAQGLLALARSGIGSLLGNLAAGRAYDAVELAGGGHDWSKLFAVPAVVTGLCIVATAALLRGHIRRD